MKKDFIVRRSITIVEGKPHVETYSEQELIRCKDCRHWIGGGIDNRDNFIPPRCTLFNEPQSADWYCPAGQRKET